MRTRPRPTPERTLDPVGGLIEDRPLLAARTVTTVVASAVTFVLALVMLVITPPYAIQSPGPTVDTVGDIDGEPLIAIVGTETYPTEGELLLTTVSTRGGPGYPATTGQVVTGWLSSAVTVVPREAAFEPGQSQDEVTDQSTVQMASSQSNASVAALTELGYDVPAELWVAGTEETGAAHGLLVAEDQLEWIEVGESGRTELTSFEVLTEVLEGTPPGSAVTLGVVRDGEQQAVEVVTDDDGEGGSRLGVLISPHAELPVDITFAIENIGGPSGGLMLALGIVDLLTPGAITGGATVAGTGTMTVDGDVGPIGGIAQKLVGARDAGAEWFLAPVENCREVVGHVPAGLDVVAVDTLAEAVTSLEAIADGRGEDLRSCTGP